MKYRRLSGIMLLLTVVCICISCSHGKSPVETVVNAPGIPEVVASAQSNRTILAVYDATIDPVAKTFTVTTSDERSADYHFPLSQRYPDVLTITRYGFTPNFWADIKIIHPRPNSGIDAFDPRVIAILPANAGVSMDYPQLKVFANNSVILNPDGYTNLYDSFVESFPGNANPFLAYFKHVEYRRWFSSGTGYTSDTRRWQMNIDGFGGPLQFKLVVDISTNYPDQPQQVIDNAPEPVDIRSIVSTGLTEAGGSASVTVTLLDWQDNDGIGGVLIESPELFDSTVNLPDCSPGPNPDQYVYSGTIANEKLAPAGIYRYLVASWDIATGIYIYNEFKVRVNYDNNNGSLLWAKQAGGAGYDKNAAVVTLSDDSVVTTGWFSETSIFGEDEPNETLLESEGGPDIYIARYTSDSMLLWAKSAGGPGEDYSSAITSLQDNSTIVTGRFEGTSIFGEGEPCETALISDGDADIFIARYNTDGTLAWAKRAGGSMGDGTTSITSLSDNSFVVAGWFNCTATFGLGEPNETTFSATGYADIFIARYTPEGMLIWAKHVKGSDLHDIPRGITTLSDNSVVACGLFNGTNTFGVGEPNQTILYSEGEGDFFIARYNPDGSLVWAKRAGSEYDSAGGSIATLSDDSTVVSGWFVNSSTFGPGEPGETTINSSGEQDIFVARYDPDGKLEWVKSEGGAGWDEPFGITVLSDDSAVMAGTFSRTAIFGIGEPGELSLVSAGSNDIVMALYRFDGSFLTAMQAGGTLSDRARGISTLSDDSIIVTGEFMASATFGAGEINETILTCHDQDDVFIARYKTHD